MPNLIIHIGRVFDRVRNFLTQKPPITLAKIVQLFFYDCIWNAEARGKLSVRDVTVFGYEIIAQSFKEPQTSFTFTLLSQTSKRLLHDRCSPAKIEKPLRCKRVEHAGRER